MYEKKYGDYTFSLNSCMAAAILFKEIRESVIRKAETDITDAVLTVPVKFTEEQKRALIDAASIAGYTVVSVIVEPVASCFNFVEMEQTSLGDRFIMQYPYSFYIISYDFGGSTFDSAVVFYDNGKYSVLATDGDKDLGGRKIESDIIDYIMNKYQLEPEARIDLRKACQNVLSDANNHNQLFFYIDSHPDIRIDLTTMEIDTIVTQYAERASNILEGMIERIQLPSDAHVYVYMTGGISMLNTVRDAVLRRFPNYVVRPSSTLHSVSRGALVYGERSMLNKQKSMRQLLKSYSHLPAEFIMRDNHGFSLSVIPMNTPLPTKASFSITLPACPDSRYLASFFAVYDSSHEEVMNKHIRINRVKVAEKAKLTVDIDQYLEVSCSIEGDTITHRDYISDPLPEKRRTAAEIQQMQINYNQTLTAIHHGCLLYECKRRLIQAEKKANKKPALWSKVEECRAIMNSPDSSNEMLQKLATQILTIK